MRIVDIAAASRPAPGRADEDAVHVSDAPAIALVVDGMGGPGVGDVAARAVLAAVERKAPLIDKLAKATEHDRTSGGRLALVRTLERMLGDLNSELADAGAAPKRCATMAMSVISGGYAHIAHVGAARAYLLRDGRLRSLTDDHTIGMVRVRQGQMSLDDYRTSPLRHRLYQALGAGGDVDVDVASLVLADRDVLLLCTDGVHAYVDDAMIGQCLSLKTADQAVTALGDAARDNGSPDHATAVVLKIAADASPEEIDTIAHALASNLLFRDLSESERLLVAPYLDRLDLARGDVLFAEGDPAEACYVVVDGRVRVTRGGTALTEIGPGGALGELSLAGPRIARSATVTATAQTVALGLTRDRFHEIVERRPAIGSRLLLRSLSLIGDRLRDLTERLTLVEKLAVGETRPGDLALRTAIVLAARGEWPPPPATEEGAAPTPPTPRAPEPTPAPAAPELEPAPPPVARQVRRSSRPPSAPPPRPAPAPAPTPAGADAHADADAHAHADADDDDDPHSGAATPEPPESRDAPPTDLPPIPLAPLVPPPPVKPRPLWSPPKAQGGAANPTSGPVSAPVVAPSPLEPVPLRPPPPAAAPARREADDPLPDDDDTDIGSA